MMRSAATIITGASGHLGSLIVAGLLAESEKRLVLPVRSTHTRDSVLAPVVAELKASGCRAAPALLDRVTVVPLPPTAEIPKLSGALRELGADEIIHAAGCVDYFNTHKLNVGNLELTRALVALGQALDVRRFFFISTAFCSGYYDGKIPETLHAEPDADPTAYTRSKRDAESIVAASGLPYIMVRPSVVVGDSRDGRYSGKRYGIYQLWHAAERFLCAEYIERIYALAPHQPMQVLHQDSFLAGFVAAYKVLEPPAVFHLVSRDDTLPTVRHLWDFWLESCACLVACILAVHGHVPWRGILVAYALTQVLASIPLTPGGIGVVEAWRGELIHWITTDDRGQISRYAIKDPSFNNWTGLAIAVRNNLVADFPLCNKSFNLSYSGNDL